MSSQLRMLRMSDVETIVGLDKNTLYPMITAGDFPKPVRLAARATRFLESEINTWLEQRIASSRGTAVPTA